MNIGAKRPLKLIATAALLAAVAACGLRNSEPVQSTNAGPPPLPGSVESVPAESNITNLGIDKKKILDSHNFIRQQLGVPPLRWSTQLETLAAGWANFLVDDGGCAVRRRGSVGLPLHKNGIGENIQIHSAQKWSDGRVEVADIDEHQVVLQWARQAVDYDYTNNSCGLNKVCENYTQVVWRDSQVVACAAASCASGDQIWVCNYDPPGNFSSQKPY